MKVYIAGKITGDENYKEKFERAEEKLKNDGHIVLSPAVLPEGMHQEDYMKICFPMIDVSDAVYFLKGFEQSKGAMLEFDYCRYTAKPRMYEGVSVS